MGKVTLFGKASGIRRFERMVSKAGCAFGEGNRWNKEKEKLKKLCTDETSKQLVDERFSEHSNLFTFFTDLKNFCDDFSPDILNLVNFLTLAFSSVDVSKTSNITTNSDILSNESPNLSSFNKISENSKEPFSEREVQLNSSTMRNNRYEGKFVSANVINLSSRHLSEDEISLLSKGLNFVPTPKHINKAKIKEEIEVYGRKLRLMLHFRNDHREFDVNPFKKTTGSLMLIRLRRNPNLTLKGTLP